MVAMGRQEERCQIVACRKGQDVSTGKKFILKSGDVVRIGRGNDNEVILDYEGVSKHHAEIFMRAKQPEEVILGADLKMTGLLSIRDLNSRNGLSIHKSPLAAVPPLGAFDRIVPGIVQAVQDGWSVLVPAKSRHQDKQMTVEQRILTLYVSSVMVDVPVPPPVQEPPPVLAPPRQLPQVTPAHFTPPPADSEIAKALKPKKKKKPKEDERPAARPKSRPEGLATISGEAWPPPLPRDESDASDGGQDIPPPKAKSGPGPGQRPLTSPRPERRRSDKVEVSSDEEGPAPRLTQANVAKVSAAAAVAVGVSEPDDVDPDLRSISPISTPGVFPWQVGKKASKKKPRPESPCSAEAQVRKKRKGETGKATKAKKLLLTAPGQGMQWDPYMPRATEPSPSPCSAIPGKASRGKSSKDVRDRFDPSLGKDAKRAGGEKKKRKEKDGGDRKSVV